LKTYFFRPQEIQKLRNRKTAKQLLFMVFGYSFVGLGLAGVVLPLVPTTPFLLLALACFARSSPALHDWLTSHRVLGKYVRDWERDRSIPLTAKFMSIAMMSASFAWLALGTNAPAIAIWMTGITLFGVGTYIVTRPTSGQ